MSGSGPSCNLRLITAGEAKSRNGTQLLPAALNYFSTTGFPSPSFNVSLLVSAASLSVFDLSFLSYSLPSSLSQSQYLVLPHLLLHLFLDLCFLLSLSLFLSLSLCLSPFVPSRHSSGDLTECSGFGVGG